LDLAQTLPSFAYLAPLALVFGIGPASARHDVIYSLPPLDLAQTLPSFAYLAPLALVFGIGPASARHDVI
ncbi:hypothetical protein CTI14_71685, partial [Methylobacterium radiotolerans]